MCPESWTHIYELGGTHGCYPVLYRWHPLASVWGTGFVGETRTVDVHIGTLRTKLDECGDMVKTVRGVGYKMEGMENEQEDL